MIFHFGVHYFVEKQEKKNLFKLFFFQDIAPSNCCDNHPRDVNYYEERKEEKDAGGEKKKSPHEESLYQVTRIEAQFTSRPLSLTAFNSSPLSAPLDTLVRRGDKSKKKRVKGKKKGKKCHRLSLKKIPEAQKPNHLQISVGEGKKK